MAMLGPWGHRSGYQPAPYAVLPPDASPVALAIREQNFDVQRFGYEVHDVDAYLAELAASINAASSAGPFSPVDRGLAAQPAPHFKRALLGYRRNEVDEFIAKVVSGAASA
jgi:hypothetical protein